jgi:hypothetical protein
MTYNFDPERWYEDRRRTLQARRDAGEIDDAGFSVELEDLDRRHDEMVKRLDGTFQLPKPDSRSRT